MFVYILLYVYTYVYTCIYICVYIRCIYMFTCMYTVAFAGFTATPQPVAQENNKVLRISNQLNQRLLTRSHVRKHMYRQMHLTHIDASYTYTSTGI